MRHRLAVVVPALLALVLTPLAARANARLVSVTPVAGACVAGPTGPNVESWDVVRGGTYVLRIDHVTDCANGGTDPSINVLVMSTALGNAPLVATQVATGTYEFTFTVPGDFCDTSPIQYCTDGGDTPYSGSVVGRHDTGLYQSHLRAAIFGPGCTSPREITCATPTLRATWGALKSMYR